MKVGGTHQFSAMPERVWNVLTDAKALAGVLPGCQRLTEIAPGTYEMELRVGVAGIKGSYQGTVRLENLLPKQSFRMTVEGKGVPGFVKGTGDIHLEDNSAGTLLRYYGDLQVGGTLAAVGQRLIQSAARMIIEQFFSALDRVAGQPAS